jgi:hypothetical protein
VIHQHPFRIVEEINFINFIHSIHPTTHIPTSDTIKSYIIKSYEKDKKIIQNTLTNLLGKISFTTDCWTSPSAKSFMAITAHFVDNNWELKHILLDFIEIYDHSGQDLKNAFVSVLENFSIEKKV